MVSCIERIGIWLVLRTWNWQQLENLLLAWVYWLCILISTKVSEFLPWFIPNTSWTPWWVLDHRASEKYTALMKKKKNETYQFWGVRQQISQIHCHWIFGGGLPNQILTFPQKKYYQQGLHRKTWRKSKIETFLSRWKARGRQKVYQKWKSSIQLSAGATCMRNSTLPRELSGVGSWHWQQKRRHW